MPSAGSVLRVFVVIDSLGQGGAEQSMMAVLPSMREHGIHAELLLLRSISPDREAAVEAAGVPVRILDPTSNPLGLARRLRPLLRAERPDLLHVTLFAPILGGSLAALGTDVPVLASQASTPPQTGRRRVVDAAGTRWKVRVAVALEAFAVRRLVTHVHAVTAGVRTAVSEEFRTPIERISVAERGRDGDRFRPPTPEKRLAARQELGVAPDAEVLVALGRHDPSKGFGDLIAAVERLVPSRPRLQLLLAGREGTATGDLQRAIDGADLGDRVHLLGDRPDPERVLAAGDLFVLSSRREGTSGATIEAMATGLPVVATELPGLAGIVIDGEQARTVPVADPVRLAAAIDEVLSDSDLGLRLGAAGLRTFQQRFTLDRSVAALAALYGEVAEAGRG